MKLVWSHNWFLEYRVAVFECLGSEFLDFHVIYASENLNSNVLEELESRVPNLIDVKRDLTLSVRLRESEGNFANTSFRLQFPLSLVKRLINVKPDVLVGEGFFRWGLIHLLMKPFLRYKYVMCYERTPHTERNVPLFVEFLRKLALRGIDEIIVNGTESERYIRSLGWKKEVLKIHMIPEKKYFSNLSPTVYSNDMIEFLFVGQLVKRKGIDILLESWNEFKHLTECNVRLTVIGLGPLENLIPVDDSTVLYEGRVEFSELDSYYKRTHFLVMPTLEDNWSMVVPESLSAGTPVISTIQNGCSNDLLSMEGAECGFVYDGYSSEELVNVLLKASSLKITEYNQMCKNARIIDNIYTLEKVKENFVKICSES